jgi:hypothetical protein
MQSAAQILAIVFAGLIALVPVLFPKYSIFRSKGQKAIDTLRELNETDELGDEIIIEDVDYENIEIGHIERGDYGFRALEIAIERHTSVRSPYDSISLIYKHGSALGFGEKGPRRTEQAKLIINDINGNSHVLLSHPFNVEKVKNLEELEGWVEQIARERSQYWTTFLVLVWTGLSIWSTVKF